MIISSGSSWTICVEGNSLLVFLIKDLSMIGVIGVRKVNKHIFIDNYIIIISLYKCR